MHRFQNPERGEEFSVKGVLERMGTKRITTQAKNNLLELMSMNNLELLSVNK